MLRNELNELRAIELLAQAHMPGAIPANDMEPALAQVDAKYSGAYECVLRDLGDSTIERAGGPFH